MITPTLNIYDIGLWLVVVAFGFFLFAQWKWGRRRL